MWMGVGFPQSPALFPPTLMLPVVVQVEYSRKQHNTRTEYICSLHTLSTGFGDLCSIERFSNSKYLNQLIISAIINFKFYRTYVSGKLLTSIEVHVTLTCLLQLYISLIPFCLYNQIATCTCSCNLHSCLPVKFCTSQNLTCCSLQLLLENLPEVLIGNTLYVTALISSLYLSFSCSFLFLLSFTYIK